MKAVDNSCNEERWATPAGGPVSAVSSQQKDKEDDEEPANQRE